MVAINPGASQLGQVNAILNGRNRTYSVHEFPGPLSIKSILRGSAVWETNEGRFRVDAGSLVVLNDQQPYSMSIDTAEITETYCVFFRAGFVEDAWRALTAAPPALLDEPFADAPPVGFFERVRPKAGVLAARLQSMYGERSPEVLEAQFLRLAGDLLGLQGDLHREMARVPVARTSTRTELFRRLTRARSIIDASLYQHLQLDHVARSACLSPFHLHRLFTRAFGETPHAYSVRRRLERASRLLAESEIPVTQACLDSGFESPGSFSSLFRRRYGVSPREFRARLHRKSS